MPWVPTVRTAARTAESILQARRVVDMADVIKILDPRTAPLVRLTGDPNDPTALIELKSCKNPRYDWLMDQALPGVDRINNAAGYTAAAAILTVDNGDYFVINDLVHVPRTGETLLVTGQTATTITVTRSWGPNAAAALVDNDELYISGTAQVENSTVPGLRSTVEITDFNYCEIKRTPFGLSMTQANSELYGGPDDAHQMRLAGIRHALYLEKSCMFGERVLDTVTGGVNAPRRSTGGLRSFITTNVTDLGGAPLTQPTLESFIRSAFRYNSGDGTRKSKVALCSRLILSALADWGGNKLQLNPNASKLGMTIKTYESPNGTLHFVPHEQLTGDEYGGWAFVLDMENLKTRFLDGKMGPRKPKLVRNRQNNDVDGFIHEYISEMGFQVEMEDTHAILRGVNGY